MPEISASSHTRKLATACLAAHSASSLHFIIPIWVFFGTDELGLSVFETSALFGAWVLAVALFEVPGGVVADRLGRKRMFVWGSLAVAAGVATYVLRLPVPFLFLGNLTYGLGVALQSGTLSPIIHQAVNLDPVLDSHDKQRYFDQYLSKEGFVLFTSRTIAFALAGLLYTLDPVLPFVAVFVTRLLAAAVAQLFIVDPGTAASTQGHWVHLSKTSKLLVGTRAIAVGFVLYIGFGLVMEQYWAGYQLFFEEVGLSATTISFVFAGASIVSAVGAGLAGRLLDSFEATTILYFRYGSLLILGVGFVQPIVALQVIAAVFAGLASGVGLVVLTSLIQSRVPSEFHSAAVSFAGFAETLVFLVGILAVGAQIDLLGIEATTVALAVLAVLLSGIGFWLWRLVPRVSE